MYGFCCFIALPSNSENAIAMPLYTALGPIYICIGDWKRIDKHIIRESMSSCHTLPPVVCPRIAYNPCHSIDSSSSATNSGQWDWFFFSFIFTTKIYRHILVLLLLLLLMVRWSGLVAYFANKTMLCVSVAGAPHLYTHINTLNTMFVHAFFLIYFSLAHFVCVCVLSTANAGTAASFLYSCIHSLRIYMYIVFGRIQYFFGIWFKI